MQEGDIEGLKKQWVYWIDDYVNGHHKREGIGPDRRLAETVLKKCKVEIAEGKYLEKQRPLTTTFDELADISSVVVEKYEFRYQDREHSMRGSIRKRYQDS